MSNYHKDDLDFARDLEAAYEVIGLPEWYQDTEQDDIKLVALYRAERIMKLERQLSIATGRPAWVNRKT